MKQLTLILLLLTAILAGGCAKVAEEAKYTVLKSEVSYELRQYEPQIVAETVVEGDFDEVGNQAFRILFNYISGENRNNEKVSMTAPVSQERDGEKISMTAPVNQEQRGDRWSITFLMPSSYTIQTLPVPLDDRIQLREIPGRLMAAITYSGRWKHEFYEEHRKKLLEWIKVQELVPAGEAVYARHNPPFTPWFMRRNEVLIPVEK